MHFRTLPLLTLSMGLVAASDPRQVEPPSALHLELEAPPECASASHVEVAVDALVHTAPARPLEVQAKIERQAEGYLLEARFGAGQRRVRGETCDAVTQALIAITALAIDPSVRFSVASFPDLDGAQLEQPPADAPSRSSGELAPTASAASSSTPPPARLGASTSPPAGQAAQRSDTAGLVVGASLLGLGEWGALPSPAAGAQGLLRGSLRGWSGELGGGWLQPSWAQVPGVPDRKGGYVSWLSLQGNACRSLGRFGAACGGLELGQMTGRGEGVSNRQTGHALWVAAALSALGRWPLGAGFALEVRATAAFPLNRPEFAIEPYDALHRPSWVSGRLSVGIGSR